MRLNLENKVVVITGGTAGIGQACVEAFLAEDCKVAVCGRSEDKLAAFRDTYAGRAVLAVRADVGQSDDMRRLAEAAASVFGGIDVWVNNAGIYPSGNLEDMLDELWRETFRVNVDGVLYGARAAIPFMRGRGRGVIVNASSYASIMPTAGRGAYGVTKAAVQHMTRVLGAELAPDHIRVVSYMPGFVSTDLTAPVMDEYETNRIQMQSAQNRYGEPGDVAPVVVFLASEAAAFITGSGVEISGGKYCVQNPYMPWGL